MCVCDPLSGQVCPAFVTAFRAGTVMGFFLTSLGVIVLYGLVLLFKLYFKDDWVSLYHAIAGM